MKQTSLFSFIPKLKQVKNQEGKEIYVDADSYGLGEEAKEVERWTPKELPRPGLDQRVTNCIYKAFNSNYVSCRTFSKSPAKYCKCLLLQTELVVRQQSM